jgi:Heterokaryon incompatibility protein (HET)
VITTTSGTVGQRKQGIAWTEISKTFQDVITITRRIGIQYIWIDSLYIIQDDNSDWEVEASKMSQYYANAYVVVSVTSAPDGDIGCFFTREESYRSLGVREKYGKSGEIFVRTRINYKELGTLFSGYKRSYYSIFERAWYFQERTLAK